MPIQSFTGRWRFLSNFYPSKIKYRGIEYPTVEHFYVSQKIKDDQFINSKNIPLIDCQELISKIKTPSEVKNFGKQLKLRKDWDLVKKSVMEWAVEEKFKDPDLRKMLIETGLEELIEGNNWHDIYWGVCSCYNCNGKGENNLGKILMKIRNKEGGDKGRIEDFILPGVGKN
jgi:ribA/ribD-fused uncharacterized protein